MRLLATATIVITAVMGQNVFSPPPPARFVVADVRFAPKSQDNAATSVRATQVEMRNLTMLALIQRAYAIDVDQIFGGPRFLELNKYNVTGKMPEGSKTADVPAMLKMLLLDRFSLVTHEDQRPLPAFVLSAGKGKHKLKQSDPDEMPSCGLTPHPENVWVGHLKCHGYPMSTVASALRALTNGTITDRVLDKTGLEGKWDIDLDFSSPGNMVNAGADGVSLFEAIEKQLGLKLEKQMVPQTVLVIDSVNEAPTPNLPDIDALLDPPPPPPTIEVATVKATPAGSKGGGMIVRPEGKTAQLEMRSMRMNALLQQAWDIPSNRITGLPSAMDDRTFDIVAKIDLGTNQGLTAAVIQPILQTLLKEHFNLKVHIEDRPVDAYKLVAVKPKMAVADPKNRATCKNGTIGDENDPRDQIPARSRLYTCRNLTMDEFVERLTARDIGAGYLPPTPVVNATKLEGMWDFTLNFSQATNINVTANSPVNPAPGRITNDPTGELSLFDAITSQLGLKLESEKRMMPALVVDHVDETPTEN